MRRACMTILMVLTTILLPVAAGALEPPHNYDTSATPPRNFYCAECHLTGRSSGLKRLDNLCYSCHGFNVKVGLDNKLNAEDPSNIFNTITTVNYKNLAEADRTMTSHNWVGPDNNAAAGAVPPTNSPLYKSAVNSTVSCARCHYVHSSGTLYQQSKPLLRMANNEDQMCVTCHKPRNTKLSSSGTHPVSFNYYSSFNTRGAAWMKAAPENVNPANPTSNLGSYLKKNRVVCSTCHKIHKADSNSATLDTYTTIMQSPATKNKGKGMLLRTDFVGPDLAPISICQNCHAYGNHNKKSSGNIQCTFCHSAHVTTDLAGNLIPGLPNRLLVNRYINYSAVPVAGGPNVRTRAVFRQTTSNADYYKTDRTGLCQVCHPSSMSSMGVAAGHLIGGVLDNAYAKCNSCHPHVGTTSFTPNGAAACGACHGRPPRVNGPGNNRYAGYVEGGYAVYTTGTANNYSYQYAKYGANNIVKDESLTPHWRHSAATYDVEPNNYGLACDECHKGNNHRAMNFQEVFLVPATNFPKPHPRPGDSITAPIAGFFAKSTNNATYVSTNTTTGTCSNVYCHSNGAPRNAVQNIYTGLVYKTIPLWPNGKNTISASAGNRCSACHDAQPATNSHAKHRNVNTGNAVMGATISCNICHKNSLSLTNFTTIDYAGAKHVNGLKEVGFTSPYDTMSWTVTSGTCSNVCHANGVGGGYGAGVAATWGTTASSRCGVCHAFPPATGAHAKHMPSSASLLHQSYTSVGVWSTSGEYIFGCANCHPKNVANHINGTVEVTLNKNHGGLLKSKNTNANDDTSGWSKNAGKLYCFASYCHSNGANGVSAVFKFYSSPDWYATFSGDKCAMCHGNSPNSGGKAGSPAHYNNNSMGTGKTGGHFVGIHYNDIYSGGNGKEAAVNTPRGSHGNPSTATTISCNTCHYSTMTSSANDKNVICATCHGVSTPNLNPAELIASKAVHLNGAIDVAFNPIQVKSKAQMRQKSFELYSATVLKRYPTNSDYKTSGAYDQGKNALAAGMWTSGTRTCANISCHNGVSITWIENMTINTCSNCHNAL